LKQKSKTEEIRKKVNDLVSKFFANEITRNELIEQLIVVLKPITAVIVQELTKRFSGYIPSEDFEMACMEAVVLAVDRIDPNADDPFKFIRKWISTYPLYIASHYQPEFFHSKGSVEIVYFSALEREPTDDDNLDDDADYLSEILPALEEDFYSQMFVNEFFDKFLTDKERQVATMLMDGYSANEVCTKLCIRKDEIDDIINSIRQKWEVYQN
jgi:hypothetical protein